MTNRYYFNLVNTQIKALKILFDNAKDNSAAVVYMVAYHDAINSFVAMYKNTIDNNFYNYSSDCRAYKNHLYSDIPDMYLSRDENVIISSCSDGYKAYAVVRKNTSENGNRLITTRELDDSDPYYKYNACYHTPWLAMVAYVLNCNNAWDNKLEGVEY